MSSDLVNSVRLVDDRWVGTCPSCDRDDVTMKKWESRLRTHQNLAGDPCPGSGKHPVSYPEVSRARQLAGLNSINFTAPEVADRHPEPSRDLDWQEDGPGRWCAVWKGTRVYITRQAWVVRSPGSLDFEVDGRLDLSQVQDAVRQVFP